jgi:RHS repeat-associated protein
MVGVTGTGINVAFTYDTDGKRVHQVLNNVTTKFIGSHYEIEGTTVRKYYFAGSTRIAIPQRGRFAVRTGTDAPIYFLQDHLGSTSITTDSSGDWETEIMYKAWGEMRYTSGTTPTKYTYTGQYSNTTDFGLMYYGARWYDSSLGRFSQPDTLIPGPGESGNPYSIGYLGTSTYSPLIVDYHEIQFLNQINTENAAKTQNINNGFSYIPSNSTAFDRFAYSFNNPIRYTDPSGHCPACIALPFVGIPGAGLVILGVAVVATVAFFAAGGPEAVANGINLAGEGISSDLTSLFSSKAGGAKSSAQHLAMLLGVSVAGFSGHPGSPDPYGRDRNHNVQGLRNDLKNIQQNMRSGENIQEYLSRQGWTEDMIKDYISQINNYIDNSLSTDMIFNNISQKLAKELIEIAISIGVK